MIELVATVSRLLVGSLLLYAGALKIPEPALFAETIKAYDVLPIETIHAFAVVVPWVEVVSGVLLIAGLRVRGAALTTLGLLVAFAIAIGVNLYRGADFSCGCFGFDGGGGSLGIAAMRVVVLMMLSCVVVVVDRSPLSMDRLLARSEGLTEGE